MSGKIALQLYSVRDLLPKDFAGTIRRIAAMGYEGIETGDFPGTTLSEATKLFKKLGLSVTSAHIFPPPVGDKLKEAMEVMSQLNSKRIVSGYGPDRFDTLDKTKRACEEFNKANALARANGLILGIHNHWWEYLKVESSYPYKVMLEYLDPTVEFQVDTYWVKTAGVDPAIVVKELGKRAPLLHIKDGPAVKEKPNVAVSDGSLDVPAIVKAGEGATEWLIVEFDSCATDIMVAVEKSCQYLRKL